MKNEMNKKEQEFANLTKEILESIKPNIIVCFQENQTEKRGAILCTIDKKMLSGEGKLNYYFTSPTYNESIWNTIPSFMKTRIREFPRGIYVIFSGWDGLIASYLLSQDAPKKFKPLTSFLNLFK